MLPDRHEQLVVASLQAEVAGMGQRQGQRQQEPLVGPLDGQAPVGDRREEVGPGLRDPSCAAASSARAATPIGSDGR